MRLPSSDGGFFGNPHLTIYSNLLSNPPQNKNIKPIAGLRPASSLVAVLLKHGCKEYFLTMSLSTFMLLSLGVGVVFGTLSTTTFPENSELINQNFLVPSQPRISGAWQNHAPLILGFICLFFEWEGSILAR